MGLDSPRVSLDPRSRFRRKGKYDACLLFTLFFRSIFCNQRPCLLATSLTSTSQTNVVPRDRRHHRKATSNSESARFPFSRVSAAPLRYPLGMVDHVPVARVGVGPLCRVSCRSEVDNVSAEERSWRFGDSSSVVAAPEGGSAICYPAAGVLPVKQFTERQCTTSLGDRPGVGRISDVGER